MKKPDLMLMRINNFGDIKALLLDNKTIKQTIFKNTFWLTVGKGISSLLNLVLIIYVVRILGATEYGKFTFALAFVSLFIIFSDLGISTIVVREFSGEKKRLKEFYSIISLKMLLGLGMLILVLIGSFFVTSDPVIQKIILILALYSFINNALIGISSSFFQARQRMEYVAWIAVFTALALMICGLFVILNFPSAKNLSYAYLFVSLISLIFTAIIFQFKVSPLKICWDKSIWKNFLLMSWPLAFAGLFGMLYSYIDSVMMGYWGQITETGWYNAAHKLTRTAYLITGLFCASLFPVLSASFKKSKEKLQKVWNYQTELMIILAFPMVVGGITLAPRIINFIYGQDFTPSILAFQILIIMQGVMLLYNGLRGVLIVVNQQRKIFWTVFAGAIINIILNLVLIPKFSLYGAAIATLITHFLIFLLLFRFTTKFTPIEPLKLKFLFISIGAILSSTIMFLIISRPQIYYLNIFLSIPIGVGVYLICFFLYQKLTRLSFTY